MSTTSAAKTELTHVVYSNIHKPKKQYFSHILPLNTSLKLSKANLSLSAKCCVLALSTKHSESLTYKDAGVDIDAGTELVRRIAKMAPGIGGFGGLFPLGLFCCKDWNFKFVFDKDLILVLGICYGLQLIMQRLGGEVKCGEKMEYGRMEIVVERHEGTFGNKKVGESQVVWMSHGDEVVRLPEGFDVVVKSQQGAVAAVEMGLER